MIIRLLQAFEDIVWDPEASPQSLPPPEWAESDNLRKREEKVWIRSTEEGRESVDTFPLDDVCKGELSTLIDIGRAVF